MVDRPKGRTVLETRIVYKRKLDGCGQIEIHKYRLVARVFRKIKGVHYEESSPPITTSAAIRIVYGIIAVFGWEARQLDVDMAYLEASVEEEIYTELPEARREINSQVSLLKKATYHLVHAGLL